jgi:hypothetical protein
LLSDSLKGLCAGRTQAVLYALQGPLFENRLGEGSARETFHGLTCCPQGRRVRDISKEPAKPGDVCKGVIKAGHGQKCG